MKTAIYPLLKARQQDLCVYSLVIHPGRELADRIVQETAEVFKNIHGTIPTPHITLAIFEARENMESTMIRWLERILKTTRCFTITLNNYGLQPPSQLYLRIMDGKPILRLCENLKVVDQYVRANACPPACFVKAPRLQIGPVEPVELPVATLLELTQKTFAETLAVQQLTLVRSSYALTDPRPVNVFSLNPNCKS